MKIYYYTDKIVFLPDGESNPGLLRDRQGSLPLDYRGLDRMDATFLLTSTSPKYFGSLFFLCKTKSGWPRGLRRCVQVAVHFCGRGFESHFWQKLFGLLLAYCIQKGSKIDKRPADSRVAQWKRAGPITQRSVDRNYALLVECYYFILFIQIGLAKLDQTLNALLQLWSH